MKKFLMVTLTLSLLLVAPTMVFAEDVPAQVTLVSPLNGSRNISTAPTLRWNPAARATNYEVEIYRFEGNIKVDVLRQTTTATSLLVRRPFLTSQRRDLRGDETIYWWRVRGMNILGNGLWSVSWLFTTKLRNVWSPFETIVEVVHLSATNQDYKRVRTVWDQEAVDWYAREQSWWIWPRKELWWEHELRATNLTTHFWSSVVGSTFDSNLPHSTFEWQPDEFTFQSKSPEMISASLQYTSEIRFNPASGRPSSINALVESEITDWPASQAWWDEVGSLTIPTSPNNPVRFLIP